MGMTTTGAYVPSVNPTWADPVYNVDNPSALIWDVILHDSGVTFLRCRATTGAVIAAWYCDLACAAALENNATVYLRDATLVVRTLNRYEILATLPHTVNNLVLTHWR